MAIWHCLSLCSLSKQGIWEAMDNKKHDEHDHDAMKYDRAGEKFGEGEHPVQAESRVPGPGVLVLGSTGSQTSRAPAGTLPGTLYRYQQPHTFPHIHKTWPPARRSGDIIKADTSTASAPSPASGSRHEFSLDSSLPHSPTSANLPTPSPAISLPESSTEFIRRTSREPVVESELRRP